MELTSFNFFIFIIFLLSLYFLVNKKNQWIVLLLSSYIFYFLSSPKTLIYLVITTITTFLAGWIIEKTRILNEIDASTTSRNSIFQKVLNNKKAGSYTFLAALFINFGLLAYFKYSGFILTNIKWLSRIISLDFEMPLLDFLLPLGISFYTFQSVGYLIDIKRGGIKSERNLGKYALFVSFFPQIIQGPISKYSNLSKQLFSGHTLDLDLLKSGIQIFLWGYFKKFVIANRIAPLIANIFDNYNKFDGIFILFAAFLYSIQIYCDFSGGIDIFRGIARIMGIELPQNFKRPFFSQSVEEYWRRWHITLGSWVRNYVFYPLSLSKVFASMGRMLRSVLNINLAKQIPTFIAMLITFLIIGIWHGPQWKFIAFGLFHASLIIFGIIIKPAEDLLVNKLRINREKLGWRVYRIWRTFLLVSLGRYFVRGDGFKYALRMLERTFLNFNISGISNIQNIEFGIDRKDFLVFLCALLLLVIIETLQESGINIQQQIQKQSPIVRWVIQSVFIISILIFGTYGAGYDELSFIYRGF